MLCLLSGTPRLKQGGVHHAQRQIQMNSVYKIILYNIFKHSHAKLAKATI